MTKDVLVSISGLHLDVLGEGGMEDEPVEVITPAIYFYKNGKHYILYDEVEEGVPGTTKNKIKISEGHTLEIMKSGLLNAHMVFERDKKNLTYYETPYGQMLVGINTTALDIDVTDDNIHVRVDYELDVNHEPLARCEIIIKIKSKNADTRAF